MANRLGDVFKLGRLTEVFRTHHQRVHEGHCLKDVSELCRPLALVNVNEVRQNYAFGENAFDFVEDFVRFLLDLRVVLHYTAFDKAHADGADFVDDGLWD